MTASFIRVESSVAVLAEKHRLSMFARDHSRGQVDEQRGRFKRSAARLAPSIPCPEKLGALQCLFTTGHDGCLLWWLYSGLGAEQQPCPQHLEAVPPAGTVDRLGHPIPARLDALQGHPEQA
jgi:hypothetical protein